MSIYTHARLELSLSEGGVGVELPAGVENRLSPPLKIKNNNSTTSPANITNNPSPDIPTASTSLNVPPPPTSACLSQNKQLVAVSKASRVISLLSQLQLLEELNRIRRCHDVKARIRVLKADLSQQMITLSIEVGE